MAIIKQPNRRARTLALLALIGPMTGSTAVELDSMPASTGAPRLSGSYTKAQAIRGERHYLSHCVACHKEGLQGGGPAPELAGEAFLARWDGRGIDELLHKMRSTMPLGQPGSLTGDVYVDILSFLLDANGFPDGSSELSPAGDGKVAWALSKSPRVLKMAEAMAPAPALQELPARRAAASAARRPQGDWRRPAAADWPMVGGDWGNTRHSTLARINAANVRDLGGAWVVKLPGETSRATPVVAGGLMFLTAGAHVYALDPRTGALVWKYKPEAPPNNLYKGVAVGEGLVFVGLSDARVIALRQETGEFVWSRLIGDERAARPDLKQFDYVGAPPAGQYISAAPTYAKGRVIVGLVNGDYGVRGRVVALDAKTGSQLWRFDTIPGPGEFGHDTWPQEGEVWKTGGAGVWMTPAVDPDLGLVVFGTGNPMPAFGGELRPGDNLFSASAIALDLETGKYRWHYQLVRHDLWEADLGAPLVFYEARIGGRKRKAVAVMRTDGYLFLLDRRTGRPLFPVEERPVPQNARLNTAPTQPFPVGADPLVPQCVDGDLVPAGFELSCAYDPVDIHRPNLMIPKFSVRSAPMAYDPGTGYFFAAGTVGAAWFKRFDDPYFFAVGSVPGQKSLGVLAAIDSRSNKIVWQKRLPYQIGNGSGALATAGGLVFHGEPDGQLQAYDTRSGALLWQFQTGFAADGQVAAYEVDGEQYVALVASRAVWSFKLGGTVAPLPAPQPPPTEVAFAGRVEETDRIDMAALVNDRGLNGIRETLDEHVVKPARARVKAGATVIWINRGRLTHEVKALDGSWRSGPIAAGESAGVRFERPGTYTYVCSEHPWVYAQIIVE